MSNEEKQIKIAYLTMRDPKDRRTWSGTYYHMAQALQKHCGEVTYIGPLDASKEKLVGRILNKASQLLLKKNFMYHHSILAARRYAKVASQKLAGQSFDVIIAPAGETAIAFLHTDTPIILLEDATYGLLQNYYPEYSNLLGRSIHEMHVLESRSLKKANVVVSSSEWAAQSAIEFYHTDEQKVHVVPLGANFETPPPHEVIQQRKKSARCKLLFPTVSWQRKGGEIAHQRAGA